MQAKDAPGFVLMVGLVVAFTQVVSVAPERRLTGLFAGVAVAILMAGIVWLWARWRIRGER